MPFVDETGKPVDLSPQEQAQYWQQSGQQPPGTLVDDQGKPVDPFSLPASDIADLVKQAPDKFDLVSQFAARPELQKDPAMVSKVADAFHQLRQQPIDWLDLLKKAPGNVTNVIGGLARFGGTAVSGTLKEFGALGIAATPKPGAEEAAAVAQEESRKELGEVAAASEQGMTGLVSGAVKTAQALGRGLGLAKSLKDYTPQDKVNALFDALATTKQAQATAAGQGPLAQAVTGGAVAVPPEETAKLSDPFSWEALGLGTRGIGAVAKAVPVPEAVSKLAEKIPTPAEVAGKTITGAAKVGAAATRAAEKVVTPVAAIGTPIYAALTHDPRLLAESVLFGSSAGEKAATLAEKAATGLDKAAEFGKQLSTGEIKSAYAGAVQDALNAAPAAAGQLATGLGFDLSQVAGADTPQEREAAVGLGTAFGLLGAANTLGRHVISGQIIGPRSFDINTQVAGSGAFPALEDVSKAAFQTLNPGQRARINAIRLFTSKAAPGTDIFVADPNNKPALADALVKAGMPADKAAYYSNQNGFSTRLNGRKVIVVTEPGSAPHEAFHGMEDVLGEGTLRNIDPEMKAQYADQWEKFGRYYASRLIGRDAGENWRDVILDKSGWGNANAAEKAYASTADQFAQESRRAGTQPPTEEEVRNAVRQNGVNWRTDLSPEEQQSIADRYISRELLAENFDAWFKHAGPTLEPGRQMPERVARTLGHVMEMFGENPLAGRRTEGLGVPLTPESIRTARLLGTSALGETKPPTVAPAGRAAAQPIIAPAGAAPASDLGDKARKLAQDQPDVPLPGQNQTQREIAGAAAEAFANDAALHLQYSTAPEEPAASLGLGMNRADRRSMIEAFRQMPDSARTLFGKLFFPKKFIQTKASGLQIQGWSPEVFAANAHRWGKFVAERELQAPYETDANGLTEKGWTDLYNDLQTYVKNQRAGLTGAGEELVVPRRVTEAGYFAPPTVGESGGALNQRKADVINMLFGFRLPGTEGKPTRAGGAAGVKLPQNIAGRLVSEATLAGRVSKPVTPREPFGGAAAIKQGVSGEPVMEVNPYRAEIEQAAKDAGVEPPSMIEAWQNLNLNRIKEAEVAPEQPKFGANPLTLQAGFMPKAEEVRTALKDETNEWLRDLWRGGGTGPGRFISHMEGFLQGTRIDPAALKKQQGDWSKFKGFGWVSPSGDIVPTSSAYAHLTDLAKVHPGVAEARRAIESVSGEDLASRVEDAGNENPDPNEWHVYDDVDTELPSALNSALTQALYKEGWIRLGRGFDGESLGAEGTSAALGRQRKNISDARDLAGLSDKPINLYPQTPGEDLALGLRRATTSPEVEHADVLASNAEYDARYTKEGSPQRKEAARLRGIHRELKAKEEADRTIAPGKGQFQPPEGTDRETFEKGIRVEAHDHPKVAQQAPHLLPEIVKDELRLDPNAYKKDEDPGTIQAAPKTFVVRHGSTEMNNADPDKDLIRGHVNVPLDNKGRQEAQETGKKIAEQGGVQHIITSDLDRTVDTAKAIQEHNPGATLTEDPGLRPWNFGPTIEGKPTSEMLPKIRALTENPDQRPPGGETFNEFKDRFLDAFHRAQDTTQDANAAIVTHYRGTKLLDAWRATGVDNDNIDKAVFEEYDKNKKPGNVDVIDKTGAQFSPKKVTAEEHPEGTEVADFSGYWYPKYKGEAEARYVDYWKRFAPDAFDMHVKEGLSPHSAADEISGNWLMGQQEGQFMPKEKKERTEKLIHYTTQEGLKELKPEFHGTGLAGAESARKKAYPELWVPRTYFGTKGYEKEAALGDVRYKAEVSKGKLYDFQKDPQGLYPSSKELEAAGYAPFDNQAATSLYEKRIHEAGYEGYINRDANAVAKFTATPVQQLIAGQYMPSPEPRALRSAAVRDPETGQIFEGPFHAMAVANALGLPSYKNATEKTMASFEHGFTTNEGEFLNRAEAADRAAEMKQLAATKQELEQSPSFQRKGGIGIEHLTMPTLTQMEENRKTALPEPAPTQFEPSRQQAEKLAPEPKEFTKVGTLKAALQSPNWAILTANQEKLGSATADANVTANENLEKALIADGYNPVPVKGSYQGVDQGKNFLVTGMTPEEAQKWGNKYGQESVLTPHGYLYGDGTVTPVDHAKTIIGPEAEKEPGWSKVEGGPSFSLGLDFSKRIPLKEAAGQEEIRGTIPAAVTPKTSQTRVRAPEEGNKLSLDTVAKEPDMQKYAKTVAQRMTTMIPGLENIDTSKPVEALKEISNRLQQNIKYLYSRATEENKAQWRKWYDIARDMSDRWGKEFGLHGDVVAAINARLSPQTDWYNNVTLTRAVLETMKSNPEFTDADRKFLARKFKNIKSKKERASQMAELNAIKDGQRLSELNDTQAGFLLRSHNELFNDMPTHDHDLEPAGGDTGWSKPFDDLRSVVSIYRNPSRENVNRELGNNHKVRSFYNNHVDPQSPNWTTIDTHAVAAATLFPFGGSDQPVKDNFGNPKHKSSGYNGTYFVFQDAYEKAAKALGILPRELQSIVWEQIRAELTPEGKRRLQKTPELIKSIHQKIDSGELTPEAGREAIMNEFKKANEGTVKKPVPEHIDPWQLEPRKTIDNQPVLL